MLTEISNEYLPSLETSQREWFLKVLKFEINSATWDLDQTLKLTEDPVKIAFDRVVGSSYANRPIDRFYAMANWAHNDGLISLEKAMEIEGQLWVDPEVLAQGLPIPETVFYSYLANIKGIKQAVVTARSAKLKNCTDTWVCDQMPWIEPTNCFIRSTPGYDEIFKAETVAKLDPDVHFDDSVAAITAIREISPTTHVVHLARPQERETFLGDPQVVVVSSRAHFAGMYIEQLESSNVAQY